MALRLNELLRLRGFDLTSPTKVVRHAGKYDVADFLRRGWFDFYQATQTDPEFDGSERIVSFIATEGWNARFVGVYRVISRSDDRRPRPGPPGFPGDYMDEDRYLYDLAPEAGYEDFRDRVVIDWGRGQRFVQWFTRNGRVINNKNVVELLPEGRSLCAFTDYLEFTLTHAELRDLYGHQEANREWHHALRAVAGVYLILATTTGRQYVGSAHGTDGIWGRWLTTRAMGTATTNTSRPS